MRTVATFFIAFLLSAPLQFVTAQNSSGGSSGRPKCIEQCFRLDANCQSLDSTCVCTPAFNACVFQSQTDCPEPDFTFVTDSLYSTCLGGRPNSPVPPPAIPTSIISTPTITRLPISISITVVPSQITSTPAAPSSVSPGSSSGVDATRTIPGQLSRPSDTESTTSSSSLPFSTSPTSTPTPPGTDDNNDDNTDDNDGALTVQATSTPPKPDVVAIAAGVSAAIIGLLLLIGWIVFLKRRKRESSELNSARFVVDYPKPRNTTTAASTPSAYQSPTLNNDKYDLEYCAPASNITSPSSYSRSSFYYEEKGVHPTNLSTTEGYGYGYGYSQGKVGMAR